MRLGVLRRCLLMRRLSVLLTVARRIILLGQSAALGQIWGQIGRQAGLGDTRLGWCGLNAGRAGRRLLRRSGRALLLGIIRILIGIRRLGGAVICGPTVRRGPRSV